MWVICRQMIFENAFKLGVEPDKIRRFQIQFRADEITGCQSAFLLRDLLFLPVLLEETKRRSYCTILCLNTPHPLDINTAHSASVKS